MTNKKAIATVLGIMCFALTAGICIQIKTVKNTNSKVSQNYEENNLRAEVLKYKEKYDNILKETEKIDAQLQSQIDTATTNNSELEEAKNQINDGNKMIGLTEVTGSGIILTIADSEIDSNSVLDVSDLLIHDLDLLKVINELKNAGAEAISINNQRIILTTPIICGGNTININGERIDLDKFKYDLYELSVDDYSIEKMYELTKGDIDYKTAISTYKNMFYLAKSRLRAYKTLEWLKTITNNNPLYDKIYEYIEKNGYGIEEEIITRLSSNNKKLSESVGFNFNNQELVDIINSYSEIVLEDIINDPINALRLHIRTLSYVEDDNVDKTEYFARAIVDSYDWKRKLNIDNLYDEQKGEIIDKLKEIDLLKYYEELKKLNLKSIMRL